MVSSVLPRPFHCTFPACPFRASSSGNSNQHVQNRHNPDQTKEFSCPLCGNAFYSKSGVNSHIRRLHSNERSLKHCGKCKFVTRYEEQLQNHYRNMHLHCEYNDIGGGLVGHWAERCTLYFWLPEATSNSFYREAAG